MIDDCEICGGSGVIRLPVMQRLPPIPCGDDKMPLSLPIREYSCPECGVNIPQEKVLIFQAEDFVSTNIKDPGYINSIKNHLAMKVGDALYRQGLMTFKALPEDYMQMSYPLRGKVGIISPRAVATFEERVRERQMDIVAVVVNDATDSIRNWNKIYQGEDGSIPKNIAVRLLYEVLHKAPKK